MQSAWEFVKTVLFNPPIRRRGIMLPVERSRGWTLPSYPRMEDDSSIPAQNRSLRREDSLQATFGQVQQAVELRSGVASFFRRRLGLDQASIGGLDHIHIDFGLRVFFITEIEQRRAFDDADGSGGDELFHGRLGQRSGFDQGFERDGEGHRRAGDGSGTRSAVGLDHVAVEDDGTLAKSLHVDDRAQAAADEALDFMRPATDFAALAFARGAGHGGAGEHSVLRRDPALAGVAQPRGNAVFDSGIAENASMADGNQDGTLGRAHKTRFEGQGTKGVGRAAVVAKENRSGGVGHREIVPERAIGTRERVVWEAAVRR